MPVSSLSRALQEGKGHVTFVPASPIMPGTEQALTCLRSCILMLILCLFLSREACPSINPPSFPTTPYHFFSHQKRKEKLGHLLRFKIYLSSFLVYLHEDVFCLGALSEKEICFAALWPGRWPAKYRASQQFIGSPTSTGWPVSPSCTAGDLGRAASHLRGL